jgi:hypothetical protein
MGKEQAPKKRKRPHKKPSSQGDDATEATKSPPHRKMKEHRIFGASTPVQEHSHTSVVQDARSATVQSTQEPNPREVLLRKICGKTFPYDPADADRTCKALMDAKVQPHHIPEYTFESVAGTGIASIE